MKNRYFILYNILIIFLFFIAIEFLLRFYFNQTEKFSCYLKTQDIRKYINDSNCNFEEKYFEKKNNTIYFTNKKGERIGKKRKIDKREKIFFVGDSFTFGYLSNYNFTYPFNAIKKINNISQKKFEEINLGVNGYQIDQVLGSINELKKTKGLIVYGLTPNDLFDINNSKSEINNNNYGLIDRIRIILSKLNLVSVQYFSSIILKNEKIYIKIYKNRGSKSGYLNKNGSLLWEDKYKSFENKISMLPQEIRDRLIIAIIPQQIQIKLLKMNQLEDGLAFDHKILTICNKIKIECISKTLELAKNQNYITHFTLDGHLLPEANKKYGELISEDLNTIFNIKLTDEY